MLNEIKIQEEFSFMKNIIEVERRDNLSTLIIFIHSHCLFVLWFFLYDLLGSSTAAHRQHFEFDIFFVVSLGCSFKISFVTFSNTFTSTNFHLICGSDGDRRHECVSERARTSAPSAHWQSKTKGAPNVIVKHKIDEERKIKTTKKNK